MVGVGYLGGAGGIWGTAHGCWELLGMLKKDGLLPGSKRSFGRSKEGI